MYINKDGSFGGFKYDNVRAFQLSPKRLDSIEKDDAKNNAERQITKMKNMRYIFLFLLLTSCKKDNEELKVYYPNGNLNYSLIKAGDTSKLMQYDENGKLYLTTKFYKDHFLDTIKYNERSDIFDQSYSIYDSVSGPYFYHTRYVIFQNKVKTIGAYRYERNKDFKKILNTEKPIGKLYNYDRDGQLTDSIEAIIINDTVYYISR